MTKTIADQWQGYREDVVPEGASEMQIEQTQLAFYAGAMTVFRMMSVELDPHEELDADLARMLMERAKALEDELDAFERYVEDKAQEFAAKLARMRN